mmetsp:Transcript_52812/g.128037  ORF Transcript_52812/g.128037 Transcript_52812/m.128037 type:complete len:1056 (-) Transcript_52812:90-3257(-)
MVNNEPQVKKQLTAGELRKLMKRRNASRSNMFGSSSSSSSEDSSSNSSSDDDSVEISIASSCSSIRDRSNDKNKNVNKKKSTGKQSKDRSRSTSPASGIKAGAKSTSNGIRRRQRSSSRGRPESFVGELRSSEENRGQDKLRKPVKSNRISRSPSAGDSRRVTVDPVAANTIEDRGCTGGSSKRASSTRQSGGKIVARRQREAEAKSRRGELKNSLIKNTPGFNFDKSSAELGLAAMIDRKGKKNPHKKSGSSHHKKNKMDFSVPPPVKKKTPAMDDSRSSATESLSSSTNEVQEKGKSGVEVSLTSTALTDSNTTNSDDGDSISHDDSDSSIHVDGGEIEIELSDFEESGSGDDSDVSMNFDSLTQPVEEKSPSAHKRQQDDVKSSTLNSSFGNLNKSLGDIATSGSNEQWARFKSMGRAGLGEIEPSPNAQTLIKQNVKVFVAIMQKLLALRERDAEVDNDTSDALLNHFNRSGDIRPGTLLDEVKETVELKKTRARYKRDPNSIVLSETVLEQLEDFVTAIAVLYRDNAFHNFEHASTVLGAVNKVVSLANPPEDIDYTDIRFITTDPWTHFALVFSALIHDVDHQGVPNAVLVEEKAEVADIYNNKSVAEQNSLDIGWALLMEPCYREMRDAIFQSNKEVVHLRKLLVTATLATDIADKELASMRRDRAAVALAVLEDGFLPTTDDIASQKATFILETLIQVADVSHLMMPFAFYKRWNYKLLRENYNAFKEGRVEIDPLDNWWKGEFGFFDFYIIPLAKKLDKCGIDSSKYVKNAEENRKKWEEIGEELVAGYTKELRKTPKRRLKSTDALSHAASTHSHAASAHSRTTLVNSRSSDALDISESKAHASGKKGKKKSDAKSKEHKSRRKSHSQHSASSTSIGTAASDESADDSFGGSERMTRTALVRKRSKRSSRTSTSEGTEKIRKPPATSSSFSEGHKKSARRTNKTKDDAVSRHGRSKTNVPDGEQRFKVRSKSTDIDVSRRSGRRTPSSKSTVASSESKAAKPSKTSTASRPKMTRSSSLSAIKTADKEKDKKTKRTSKSKKSKEI